MLRSFHRKSDKCETAPLSTIAQHITQTWRRSKNLLTSATTTGVECQLRFALVQLTVETTLTADMLSRQHGPRNLKKSGAAPQPHHAHVRLQC